jgi:hypothetical protein
VTGTDAAVTSAGPQIEKKWKKKEKASIDR